MYLFLEGLQPVAMIGHIFHGKFIGHVSLFEHDCDVHGDEFVFGGVHEADEVGAVLAALEGGEVFEVEGFVVDHSVVVFVDVEPDGLLVFDVVGDGVDAVEVLVGVAVEVYHLCAGDGEFEVLVVLSVQFEEIIMEGDAFV
jgi:hypothetical protein